MNQLVPIRRDAEAGVTLVEILVVLALLGVVTGAVALGFGGAGRSNSVVSEAELLVARLNRAADEAVLSATAMRFEWQEDGYSFEAADSAGNWARHPVAILGEPRSLVSNLTLTGPDNATFFTVDANLIPTPRQVLALRLTSNNGGEVDIIFDGITAAVSESGL